LIVVPFGGIKSADIARQTDWKAIALTELQMLPPDGLDHSDQSAVDHVIGQIIASLRELPDLERPRTPLGSIAARLSGLIDIDLACWKELAWLVAADIAGIVAEEPIRRRVLRRLYEMGALGLTALEDCPCASRRQLDRKQILELLSTSWVEISASASLLPYSRYDCPQQTIAINGTLHHFTPRAYVRQVCNSSKPWPVITLVTKSTPEEVLEQIRADLVDTFHGTLRGMIPGYPNVRSEIVDANLNELLESRLKAGELPVFVAIPPEAATDTGLMELIHRTYSQIRLIVCFGTAPGHAKLTSRFRMLEPELNLQEEQTAYRNYNAMRSVCE
jgi:hypothetical protein